VTDPCPDGLHLTARAVPLPSGLSDEARALLLTPPPLDLSNGPMWHHRQAADRQFALLADLQRQLWPVAVTDDAIGGVPVKWVAPPSVAPMGGAHVLMNLHGGGFVLGSGSLVEAIPIAHLTQLPVVMVDYRLAPEHPFPAAVEDAVAAYRGLLDHYAANRIILYGSSAGAALTMQTVLRLRELDLPLPAALGGFSPPSDLSDLGDSGSIFTLNGLWGDIHLPPDHVDSEIRAYLGGVDPKDPRVSPVYADLTGLPPTLLLSGSRDLLLSGTIRLHVALKSAGVEAHLAVFEAMPHCHWLAFHLPEARQATAMMVDFFQRSFA
jgi:epsilon-lactone hydrolase